MKLHLFVVGFGLMAASAQASYVEYRYEGQALDGTPFTFQVVIDPTAPDVNTSDAHVGHYLTAVQSFVFNGGEPQRCGEFGSVHVTWHIDNFDDYYTHPYHDSFFVGCGGSLLELTGDSPIFLSDAIPLSVDIAKFNLNTTVWYAGIPTYGHITDVSAAAVVPAPITPVPEPVSGLLLLLGLAAVRLHPRR